MTASVTPISEFVFGHRAGDRSGTAGRHQAVVHQDSLRLRPAPGGIADFTLSYQQLAIPSAFFEVKADPQKNIGFRSGGLF